jgi:hypothetical protein
LALPRPARAAEWEEAKGFFRQAQKAPDWRERKDAFVRLMEFDRAEAVAEVLAALGRESNPAVLLMGIDALASFQSPGAKAALVEAARKGRGAEQLYVLVALEKHTGPDVEKLLLDVAKAGPPPAAAQAALDLARHKTRDATAALLALLGHGSWQVRAAAARSLGAHGAKEALGPLAAALETERGRARADLVAALEAISKEKLGYDPPAWKRLAAGDAPASIAKAPREIPSAFGVPIYGERVVVCLDDSLRMGDPHPFGERDRLVELCSPKDGAPINWIRIKSIQAFAHAHVRHLVQGLATGVKFEVLVYNETVHGVFGGRLTSLNAGTRKAVADALDALKPDNGIAAYPALVQALDVAGPSDGTAWKSGPDEVMFIGASTPTAGEITEADVIAAAIALKARLRMVPIHTVGIHTHPYDMHRAIAERTGGVYVDLTK